MTAGTNIGLYIKNSAATPSIGFIQEIILQHPHFPKYGQLISCEKASYVVLKANFIPFKRVHVYLYFERTRLEISVYSIYG